MPLDATIGQVFVLYCPAGCHGHRFWRKKLSCGIVKSLFEASVQKARNGPSTQLIEASNTTIKAKEHSYLSSDQTLITTDKNLWTYQSSNKLVTKWALMSALSCFNSLTANARSVSAGTKNSCSEGGFLLAKHTAHKYPHHDGVVFPSSRMV